MGASRLASTDEAVEGWRAAPRTDQDSVSAAVAERHPEAAVIVPPRSTAVPSSRAEAAPTQRDRRLQFVETRGSPDIAEHSRAAWQKASRHAFRARVGAAIGRFKQMVGAGLRSCTDQRRATEVDIAVDALNRMLDLGRPNSVRIA